MMRLAAPWQPKRWSWDEYEALPEATGRGCPLCVGLHYGCVNTSDRTMPPVYRCHGTDVPNWDVAPYSPPCGGLFRGVAGDHFDAGYYAASGVGVFLTDGRSRTLDYQPELPRREAALTQSQPVPADTRRNQK